MLTSNEFINKVTSQTHFMVGNLDDTSVSSDLSFNRLFSFYYPYAKWDGAPAPLPPRSSLLATLIKDTTGLDGFKQEKIDWKKYRGIKPTHKDTEVLVDLINEYIDTPILDRICTDTFWIVYLDQARQKINLSKLLLDKNYRESGIKSGKYFMRGNKEK